MVKSKKRIYVIGHKNPDTDSVCSAIAYAKLRRKITGNEYVPKRIGGLNDETKFVLKKFGVETPERIKSVRLQVQDIDMHEMQGVDPSISILDVWNVMQEQNIKTVPVLRDDTLLGMITTGDIAKSYMEVHDNDVLSKANTMFGNIAKVLDGKILIGDEKAHFNRGRVVVGASDVERMKEFLQNDDMLLIGNREDAQRAALGRNVSCMIICNGTDVSEEILRRAEERETVIITTDKDTFTAGRLINQAIPVSYFMKRGNLITFHLTDYIDDIREQMTSNKYRDFPVLDRHDRYVGFISRRRLLNTKKKQVCLVDHNEKGQAVDGIEEAEILEIIDHHKIGDVETINPVYFRNQPVGCTATIINQMYEENGVKIDKKTAGIMCAAILSDTLMFRSPTCTKLDEATAKKLAGIAKVDIEKLAKSMFKAGSSLDGKTPKEICFQDFKQFSADDIDFGVGQINFMDGDEIAKVKKKLIPYLPTAMEENGLDNIYLMLTDILNESSEIICYGEGAREAVINGFDLAQDTTDLYLEKVVSRKKQFIPTMLSSLHQD